MSGASLDWVTELHTLQSLDSTSAVAMGHLWVWRDNPYSLRCRCYGRSNSIQSSGPEHSPRNLWTESVIVHEASALTPPLLPTCLRCAVLSRFSRIWLIETSWTIACQDPLSMRFSRQEYWIGLPFPPAGDLPNPRIKLSSLKSSAWGRRVLYH